jgi:hypothetical protein
MLVIAVDRCKRDIGKAQPANQAFRERGFSDASSVPNVCLPKVPSSISTWLCVGATIIRPSMAFGEEKRLNG